WVPAVPPPAQPARFWPESPAGTTGVLDTDSSLSAVERRQLRISLMANQALGAEWRAGGLRLGFLRFELK
ncbi:SAM-dependent methyltransferase, partial [Streptomyces sp. NPDC127079]